MNYTKLAFFIFACSLKANTSSILHDSTHLGSSNWYESPWLGVYFESSNSWAYHEDFGWLYIPSSNEDSFWMYNADLKWIWTKSTVYPWVYLNEIQDWRFYLPNFGFWNAANQSWSTLSQLVSNEYNSGSGSYTSQYYSSGSLVSNNSISAWFDRSLEINGLQLFVAGQVGGQTAVPAEWARKVAQTVKLLTSPNDSEIDISSQERMIQVLKGASGTWHAGLPAAQRLAYGGGMIILQTPLPILALNPMKGIEV